MTPLLLIECMVITVVMDSDWTQTGNAAEFFSFLVSIVSHSHQPQPTIIKHNSMGEDSCPTFFQGVKLIMDCC